jgi:drug/metabolite transporter (DMT)-like permease
MLLMLGATLVLTVMHAIVRHLGQSMHPFEIVFFRNLFGLVAVLPLVVHGGPRILYTRRPALHALRGALATGAMLSWFYSLSIVPIAEATALSFMAVIFASLGAVFFLGENMRIRRWSAVIASFTGAMLILRPGFHEVSGGALLVLGSSVCWGLAVVTVKQLSRTESVVSIVAWMAILLTSVSIVPALWVWQWPTWSQLAWLALVGGLATAGHLAMTQALKIADTTSILPLDFTRLVWAAALGYLVFGEVPDRWTWLGGGIIVSSATYLMFREASLARRGKA